MIRTEAICIVVISGIACCVLFTFCKYMDVQVVEIEEYYAKKQQHIGLKYLFKVTLFVLTVSLAFNLRFLVMDILKNFTFIRKMTTALSKKQRVQVG